ncbi:hypothetical protein K8W59_13985 [Nocardioides rotundus]|uniref:hypothetical protein n=1 Tax=Nocardioides rotundus TaxID=1774216 RepID=UPI001CBD10DE|nr:hypothetical protein [Nocardioides rotundus]UAL28915.1 hypothetical protein K8W59_13985 [Nocardioides rotundus]
MRNRLRPVSLLVAMLTALMLALATGGVSATAAVESGSTGGTIGAVRTVADNAQGTMKSRIVGTTGNGRQVTGNFVPLKFIKKDGTIRVRGLINGVVHNTDGSTQTFSALRTMKVAAMNGTPVTTQATSARQAPSARAAACDVLKLRLGPLDLDVLGLKINLNRVVLDIVAQSGAGKLLGNLLCAVAGLLDGGLSGLLGRITDLLNQILGSLRLGG